MHLLWWLLEEALNILADLQGATYQPFMSLFY
jgi:hypothetical protein